LAAEESVWEVRGVSLFVWEVVMQVQCERRCVREREIERE